MINYKDFYHILQKIQKKIIIIIGNPNLFVKRIKMKDLTTGNIYKNFILFAFPMVLSGLLTQAYATIDTVIAGKYLGEVGLAAVGATAPLVTFVSSTFWGISVGFAVYIANLFGSKQYKRIKSAVFTGFTTFSLLVFAVSLLLIVFRKPLYSFLKIDSLTLHDADIYFMVYVAGLAFIILNTYNLLIMNSFGISTFPFVMSIVSAGLNIFGNIFTIVVLGWGVFGVAASSVASALIVDICYLFKYRECFREMGVSEEKMHFTRGDLSSSVNYVLPNTIQQMTMYASGFLISPLVNSIGQSATAAYTVVHRIYEINATVYQNSSKTVANYTAQANGADKKELFGKGVRVGFIQAFLFALPFILACVFFSEGIVSLFFNDDADVQAIRYSVTFLRYYLPFILFNVVANLYHAFFRGLGEKSPLIVATFAGSLSRIVVSVLLVPSFGMAGMYIGWVSNWISDALVGVLYYRKKQLKN